MVVTQSKIPRKKDDSSTHDSLMQNSIHSLEDPSLAGEINTNRLIVSNSSPRMPLTSRPLADNIKIYPKVESTKKISDGSPSPRKSGGAQSPSFKR